MRVTPARNIQAGWLSTVLMRSRQVDFLRKTHTI